jgi:hypothetical protein
MERARQQREERLGKQRLRQRENRARKKEEGGPSYEDLARGVLDLALTYNLKLGRHQELQDLRDGVAGRLRTIGFHESDTVAVWLELQARYERGWSMLRQRRTMAEMEGENSPEKDE